MSSFDSDISKSVNPNPAAPRPPAANAFKHGFCASKHLDPAILAHAESIRERLVLIHEPVSAEEIDVIEDLAVEQARCDSIQKSLDSATAHDRGKARDRFENDALKRLSTDLDDLNTAPHIFLDSLARTFEGVRWLVEKWAAIIELLAPGEPGITSELAICACFALGSRWRVSQATPKGSWLMARFVKSSLEPNAEFKSWIERSGNPSDASRARWYVERAPDPAACRRELLAEARLQHERWSLRLNELRPEYETEAATAADRVLGVLPGDRDHANQYRVQVRYLTSARVRVEKLQRRLDALKKNRPLHGHRAARKSEREERQRLRESEPAPAMGCDEQPVRTEPVRIDSPETIADKDLPHEVRNEPNPPEAISEPAETDSFDVIFEDETGDTESDEPPPIEPESAPENASESDPDGDCWNDIEFETAVETGTEVEKPEDTARSDSAQTLSKSVDTPGIRNGIAGLSSSDKALHARVSDVRIPLGQRIDWLAERFGVRFEDFGLGDA